MGRPRAIIRPVHWKISVPMDLAAAVEEAMFDSKTRKARYGGRSELVVDLLRKWLESEGLVPVPVETSIPQQGSLL